MNFDLFVIGGGSGGVRAARIAASHGAKVGLAEGSRMGGTCVIRGCVPKKLMVIASRFADGFEDMVGFGWNASFPTFDWATLRDNVAREVTRLEGIYAGLMERNNVQLFKSYARFVNAHTLELEDGTRITAKTILIATGGTPFRAGGFEGAHHALVSDDVFTLSELPKTLVVVGGGFIALEFASVFARLGTRVHVVHRSQFLKGFDEAHVAHLESALAQKMTLHKGVTIERIAQAGATKEIHLSDGTVLQTNDVLYAAGRVPNISGLNLAASGVAVNAQGAIGVNEASQTNVPHIYAVGDVTNRVNLTPVAIREGHAFADSVFGGKPWVVDYAHVPMAVFTTPELAGVGLNEKTADQQGLSVRVFESNFRPMRAVLAGTTERTLMKLVVETNTERVLGCHILGENAAEMVQLAAIGVANGLTKAQFDRTVALHPTAAEELVTMR